MKNPNVNRRDNARRAKRGKMLVECYYKATDGGETDELIQDAIADILHYAFSVNKDFPSACLRMAERHFRVEAGLEAE